MTDCIINIADNKHRFVVGQTLTGTVDLTVPEDVPLSAVQLSFHCMGEVKWIEYPGTPYYLNGFVYYDKYSYLDKEVPVETELKLIPKDKPTSIPFSFVIPKEKGLPSTMISTHGFIQYFVKVAVRVGEEVKKFVKEVIIESPIEENLMITVGSTAEKNVLLHAGKVNMHASIGRKGFAPGENISVHVHVDNASNAAVKPRISLHQVQIYMCGSRHKTIETTLSDDPVTGTEVGAHAKADEVLHVKVPADESLTIKSSVITVKYFVHVTLDIPHSVDLHINLPVVLTSSAVLEELRNKDGRLAEVTH